MGSTLLEENCATVCAHCAIQCKIAHMHAQLKQHSYIA